MRTRRQGGFGSLGVRGQLAENRFPEVSSGLFVVSRGWLNNVFPGDSANSLVFSPFSSLFPLSSDTPGRVSVGRGNLPDYFKTQVGKRQPEPFPYNHQAAPQAHVRVFSAGSPEQQSASLRT